MTKIFSTPKEVLTRVEAIPPADMEKIQKLLDSYIDKELELPSKLASATVIRELERSGWVVRDTGYNGIYRVYPKTIKLILRPSVKTFAAAISLLIIPLFILFVVACWMHTIPGIIITGLLSIVLSLLTITDV